MQYDRAYASLPLSSGRPRRPIDWPLDARVAFFCPLPRERGQGSLTARRVFEGSALDRSLGPLSVHC